MSEICSKSVTLGQVVARVSWSEHYSVLGCCSHAVLQQIGRAVLQCCGVAVGKAKDA
jgi:hypothetical protein